MLMSMARPLVRCYMNLWGVVVLELDCHPDHNRDYTTHLGLVHRPIP